MVTNGTERGNAIELVFANRQNRLEEVALGRPQGGMQTAFWSLYFKLDGIAHMAPGKLSEAMAAGLTIIGLIAVAAIRVTPPSWFPWDVVTAFGLIGLGLGALFLVKRMRRAQIASSDNVV